MSQNSHSGSAHGYGSFNISIGRSRPHMYYQSSGSSMVVIIIVLLLIILLIGAGFYIYHYNKSITETITPAPTTTSPSIVSDMKSEWGFIKNVAGGSCLAVMGTGEPNDNVQLGACTNQNNQLWKLTDTNALHHYSDNLCMDPAGTDAAKGVNVGLYTCDAGSDTGADQTWNIDLDPVDNTKFRFINQKSNLCLDTVGTSGDAGSNILIGDCTGTPNQEWTFIPSAENFPTTS